MDFLQPSQIPFRIGHVDSVNDATMSVSAMGEGGNAIDSIPVTGQSVSQGAAVLMAYPSDNPQFWMPIGTIPWNAAPL